MKTNIYGYLNQLYKVADQQIRPISGRGSGSLNLDPMSDIFPKLASSMPEVLQIVPAEVIKYINEWKEDSSTGNIDARKLAAILDNPTKQLTAKDEILFKPFRWFPVGGKQNIVMAYQENSYTLIGSLDAFFGTLVEQHTLHRNLDNKYKEMLRESYSNEELTGLLSWDLKTKRGSEGWIYPMSPLKTYYEESMDYFLGDSKFRIAEPEIISNDPTQPAYTHLHIGSSTGGCPLLDAWINLRFSPADGDLFRAYVCSIFDVSNHSRQALWLTDNGQTGKTTVLNAISEALGRQAVATISSNDLNSAFVGSLVYGKRLLIVGDNKNPKLIQSGVIHNILGGDVMNVEFKGQTSFPSPMHCRMLIASNILPDIDTSAAHEKSRVLILQLVENKKLTREQTLSFIQGGNEAQLTTQIADEIDAFVDKYQDLYNSICPSHGNLLLSPEADERMYGSITTEEIVMFEYIIDKFLVFGEEQHMTKALLQSVFKATYPGEKSHFAYANFRKRMSQEFSIQERFLTKEETDTPVKTRMLVGVGVNCESLLNVSKILDAPIVGDWLRKQDEGDSTYV